MKRLLLIAMLIGVILSGTVLTGCIAVNLAEKIGPITTQEYNLTDFTGIDIGHAFELSVTPSANYSVSITTGNNVLSHINVHKDGSILVIEMEGWTDVWFASWHTSPKVAITMPVLTELKLSGAAKANVAGFKSSHDFELHLSGASEADIAIAAGGFYTELSGASRVTGNLSATISDIELSGASHIKLTGTGGDISLKGSGASDADLKGYLVHNASIDFSGASHATMAVNGRLDVSLSGASSLEYTGHPTIGKTDISGSSNMKPINAPDSGTY